jgi:predicted lysophospholipase L1 biosynthesis ABC-type transport system permease subunit
MAIGARPAEILRMILGQGLALALVGVVLGLVGALWLTRVLQKLLFEVAPTDPLTYVGVGAVLGLAALVACYVPARRASRVDHRRFARGVEQTLLSVRFEDGLNRKRTGRNAGPTLLSRKLASLVNYSLLHRT